MMEIRPYIIGEEEAIWDVVFKATREVNARDYHPELIERWAPVDKDMVEWRERLVEKNPFVAVIDQKIIGMAEVAGDGFIDYFYVDPELHGGGVGTALMRVVEAEARESGAVKMTAMVSVSAKGFFEARGFGVTEVRANAINGHPAPNFAMLKALG